MADAQGILVFNERIKLVAGFANALAIGIIGIAVFKPIAEGLSASWLAVAGWGMIGLAIHVLSHYILGHLRSEMRHATLL
ncbi:MAG: hypothetical protein H3C51_11955 [Rubellimicrobium sp.]|nr:hypothetical protein [Rubellimicrobium sp.]